ncbi:MAG TPA: hypothetical protein VLT47_03285 [Anaeromyxobacteraceae bacterium]|nr:hypothetical protein [Anaeromyxobacteraceae bacterium]
MTSALQPMYDFRSQFNGTAGGTFAITRWISEWGTNPYFKPIDPWYAKHTLPFSNAKLQNVASVPMHKPGVDGWAGKFVFDQPSGLFVKCNRALFTKGTKGNLFDMANFDVSGFDKSPAMMSIELGNVAPLNFVAMLNGAMTGTAVDENGNKPPNYQLIVLGDQIYGGSLAVLPASSLTAWATGTAYSKGQKVTSNGYVWMAGSSATSGASAPTGTTIGGTSSDGTITWTNLCTTAAQAAKPVNPSQPDFMSGTTWTNARENFDITADNVVTAIVDLQKRRAMNGIQLGLATKGKVTVLVPYDTYERTRQLVEVFRQIPGTGVTGQTPAQVAINGGGSQVIYSVQDNPAFGRADIVAVPGLLSTRWIVLADPPPDMPPTTRTLFAHAMGGNVGEWQIQDDPTAMGGDTVPHISVFQFPAGAQSPMFTGAMEGTRAGDIGVAMLLAEGYASGTGILGTFCDTGYMTS